MLEFFDQLLDGERVAISEMKDKVPEHSEVWRGRWERMTEKLDAADERRSSPGTATYACDQARRRRWWPPCCSGSWSSATSRSTRSGSPPRPCGAVTLIAILAVARRSACERLDPEHRERAARWQSFERWTEDFPRLSDDPPATLALWKRILVYGVAFGTADRMISSGRIPEPGGRERRRTAAWLVRLRVHRRRSTASSFDGSSFSSSFASQVAPQSSSSGGGGGFSGGGGGFSGGGGGGSW